MFTHVSVTLTSLEQTLDFGPSGDKLWLTLQFVIQTATLIGSTLEHCCAMYVNLLTVGGLISLITLGKVVATIPLTLALTVVTVITYIRAVELARLRHLH